MALDRAVTGSFRLRAATPELRGDLVRCPCVEALDAGGRVVLRTEDAVARRIA
ncbi:MAG: hypothetical protein R3F59_14560 [Myxococcota bacterium]